MQCERAGELAQLREAIVKLTVIQEHHAKTLELLAHDKEENTKLKAKLGGIVLTTSVAVSAFWSLILVALSFLKR